MIHSSPLFVIYLICLANNVKFPNLVLTVILLEPFIDDCEPNMMPTCILTLFYSLVFRLWFFYQTIQNIKRVGFFGLRLDLSVRLGFGLVSGRTEELIDN